jgi:hypothetical protein
MQVKEEPNKRQGSQRKFLFLYALLILMAMSRGHVVVDFGAFLSLVVVLVLGSGPGLNSIETFQFQSQV